MGVGGGSLWGGTLPGGPITPPAGIVTYPVTRILNRALRMIGVTGGPMRTPAPEETAEAFDALNSMVDAWNTERLIIYQIQRLVFPLNINQQAYQIGVGSPDFNVPRPPRIEYAGVITLANPIQPLELTLQVLTPEQWAGVPIKNILSALPLKLYYDQAYPLGIINYWPIPSGPIPIQTALYVWNQISQFLQPTDQVTFPPGYLNALEYNLAVDLYPQFQSVQRRIPPLSQVVIERALEYKGMIKRLNTFKVDMACDPATLSNRRVWNWITGDWVK